MFDIFKSKPKEKRTQFHLRDDGKFELRKLDVEEACLVEKDSKGEGFRAWRHFYKLQFPFPGFGKIKADMVTLSYDRDVIFDPYNILEESEKPTKGKDINDLNRPWITEIAQAQRYKAENQQAPSLIGDKITYALIVVDIVLVLAVGIGIAW